MQARAGQAVGKRIESHRPIFRRRTGIILLFAVLLIAAGSATYWWWSRESNIAAATRLLVRQFSQQRPVEGRLAGGFKGGRFVPRAADDDILQSRDIIKATRLIDQARSANEPGWQLGKARLLLLTGQKGTASLKAFRQTVETDPTSADAHNDLGVCLLARGQLEDALEAFNTALQQQPAMSEALFNRALCYQQLQLRDAASTEFARLLEVEHDPGWRDEISHRHDEVSSAISPDQWATEVATAFDRAMAAQDVAEASRIADDNIEVVFNYASGHCLSAYLKAVADGEAKVGEPELAKIGLIGQRLVAACGDQSLLDLVAHLQKLSAEEAAGELALFREYRGTGLPGSTQTYAEIQAIWERLQAQFSNRGNRIYELNMAFQASNIDYTRGLFAPAMTKMREVLRIVTDHHWSYWRALSLVQMANICAGGGQDSLALTYCQQAILEGQNIPKVQSKALQAMANACWRLGKTSDGLQYLRQSSQIFSTKFPSREDLANNALQSADFYGLIHNHELALLYAEQALRYAEADGASFRVAQTISFIALELTQLKRFEESDNEMQRAFAKVEKVPLSNRDYTEALVRLHAGEIASQRGNPELAGQYFNKAEAIARNLQASNLLLIKEQGQRTPAQVGRLQGANLLLIKVLKARATNFMRAGQPQRARTDLEQAISLIEAYRLSITDLKSRSDFFAASQDAFDQMIQLQAHTFGEWDKAFNTSERARARTLLDDLSQAGRAASASPATAPAAPTGGAPLTLEQIRATLPEEMTLVSYSVTSAGSIIFVVTHNGFTAVESPATTETLDTLVETYLADLRDKVDVKELAEPSRKLYDLLVAPVEAKLGTAMQLCIAPDKALHRLPFAALLDRAGRYVIQSHSLTSAPSASTLAYCIKQASRKAEGADGDDEKLLAVGNPQIDRNYFKLTSLVDAEREALESAKYYIHPTTLIGPRATKAAALAALATCDVAHFSTHCLVEERAPWLAALVLGSSSGDNEDGLLRLNEFNKIGLLRARLVILSACQSALGQYYRGEGIVSLVRPFLARSVPTVVASLWPVDSQATAMLMINFHQARRQNHSPTADALRAAQLQMMQGDLFNHPYYWAPFVVIGSN